MAPLAMNLSAWGLFERRRKPWDSLLITLYLNFVLVCLAAESDKDAEIPHFQTVFQPEMQTRTMRE